MLARVIIQVTGGDTVKPKELIKILEADGWQLQRIHGSHYIYKHPDKVGLITLPLHNKDLKIGTLNQILKIAGLK